MAAVQMNTRIDSELKAQGDAAFAELGYSPSEAVRLVWGFAARNRHNRKALDEMVLQLEDPRMRSKAGSSADEKQSACKSWFARWDEAYDQFFESAHCNREDFEPTNGELLDESLGLLIDEEQERLRLGLSREAYDRMLFDRWKAMR